jgi:hypothetical protein
MLKGDIYGEGILNIDILTLETVGKGDFKN